MTNYGDGTKRVPGLLFNIDYGLLLKFQLNPTELQVSKTNNYTPISVPGWTEPAIVWGSGNAKTVSWTLFFDSSFPAAQGGGLIPAIGVRDIQAVLESFLYPGLKINSPSIKSVKDF